MTFILVHHGIIVFFLQLLLVCETVPKADFGLGHIKGGDDGQRYSEWEAAKGENILERLHL